MIAKPLGYVRELDGIRALAVLMVIVSHWFPGGISGRYAFGAIGVDIFFVLSGFLITRILLVDKLNVESFAGGNSKLSAIKNFMIRRSLRIFPVYYLLLALLIVFRQFFPNPVLADWQWYFFYLQNIHFYINQAWPGGKLSHLWSLAVEEQFYLLWPWLVLFVPRKFTLLLILLSFCFGALSGFFLLELQPGYNTDLLTFSCIHAFAAGGAVAYFHVYNPSGFPILANWFIACGVLSILYLFMDLYGYVPLKIDIRTMIAISASGLIAMLLCQRSKKYFFSFILGNEILVFIGKISYGIYLFHNFIPLLFNGFLRMLSNHRISILGLTYIPKLYEQTILFYLIAFILLLFVATLSFFLFEKKMLSFKKYF